MNLWRSHRMMNRSARSRSSEDRTATAAAAASLSCGTLMTTTLISLSAGTIHPGLLQSGRVDVQITGRGATAKSPGGDGWAYHLNGAAAELTVAFPSFHDVLRPCSTCANSG